MAEKSLVFTVLGIDRASGVFNKVGKSMDRLGVTALKALGGITAGSAGAAAGVAAAVGGLPVAFAGLGAVALKENTQIRRSFEDLSESVRTGLMADAAPLQGAFVDAAEQMGSAYQQLRPQMVTAFEATVPHVRTLMAGVTEFATNAMPGMVRAVTKADPVMQGFRALLRDSGVGLGEFFTIISEGAPAAGEGIEHFGALVRALLPAVAGSLVGASALWAEHGDEVVNVVTRIIDVLGQMSGGALPVMSAAVGVALDVLSGVLAVIEPMAGAIGPVIGAWLSLAVAMKAMRAVQGVVDGVGSSVGRFRDQMSAAAGPGGAGKLATTVGGVASLFGGPWGVAVAGAAAVLSIFGARSQEAAADQRTLTSALRESNGEFNGTARAVLVNTEAYKAVADLVGKAGLSHGQFVEALVAGGPAFDGLKAKLRDTVAAETELITTDQGVIESTTEKGIAASGLMGSVDGLRGTIQGAIGDVQREQQVMDGATGAMERARPGTDALREALKTLGDATADTASHVDALNTAWREMYGLSLNLEEATAAWEEGLDTLREGMEQAKGGSKNWRDALFDSTGAINLTTEEGRKLQAQLVQMGDDYRGLAQSAFDSSLAQGESQADATAAATAATAQRRDQFMREAQQMGFNADQARRLADRYFGIPSDVWTTISARDHATGTINYILQRLAQVRDKTVTIRAIPFIGGIGSLAMMGSAFGASGGLVQRFAAGGPVRRFPGGGPVSGNGGPREDLVPAMLSDGEFVINARDSKKNRALLEHLNGGGRLGMGAAVVSAPQKVVLEVAGGRDEFAEFMGQMMRKYVRVRGGNVQTVIGGAA
jgi:hypothetical protein